MSRTQKQEARRIRTARADAKREIADLNRRQVSAQLTPASDGVGGRLTPIADNREIRRTINFRGWSGKASRNDFRGRWQHQDRFGDRPGLVIHAASELDADVDRLGLAAALHVLGSSILSGVLIHPDEIVPEALARLKRWAAADNPVGTVEGPQPWIVASVSEFSDPMASAIEKPWAFFARCYRGAGPCVTVDHLRMLGLFAEHVVERRGKNAGSWQFWLPGTGRRHPDGGIKPSSPHIPSLYVSSGRTGNRTEFAPCRRGFGKEKGGRTYRGDFPDPVQFAEALDGDRSASYAEHRAKAELPSESLALSVTVDPEGANRVARDVRSIHELMVALDRKAADWFTSPQEREESKSRIDFARTTSGALASLVLEGLGIVPPMDKFPLSDEEYGRWCEGFHGGLTEVHPDQLGTPVPGGDLDQASGFPRAFCLIEGERILTAECLVHRDVTQALVKLCRQAIDNPEVLLDRRVWARFGCTLVEVQPDGELWPIEIDAEDRADGRFEVTHVSSPDRSFFFAWPDVLAAAIRSRRVPQILKATRLVPVGRQEGLRSELPLLPGHRIDTSNFVTRLVELRREMKAKGDLDDAAHLRVLVNSLVFGNFARFDPELKKVGSAWQRSERPGPWNFIPIASSVTAGCRLLIALLDRMVSDAGGEA